MPSQVWFGTKANMQWIPCPSVDVAATKQGYGATVGFLGGGAWVRRSKTSAKAYSMSWVQKSRDTLRPILDYAEGVYGDGYIYYLDPFAMDKNVLPAWFAQPAQNYYDGPFLVDGVRPTLVTDDTSTNGRPVESAVYKISPSSNVPSVFIPIPPGHTFGIGAMGQIQSGFARVSVTPVLSPTQLGTTVTIASFSNPLTAPLVSDFFAASSGIIGVNVSLQATSNNSLFQLNSVMAQVRPDGESFPTGPGQFISGQGTSGLKFQPGSPTYSQYSHALDRVGVSANLIETEAWSWR